MPSNRTLFAYLIAFVYGVAAFGGVSASMAQSSPVRAVYSVDTFQSGRFTSTLTVTNMTATTLSNWSLSFRLPATVSQIENVSWTASGSDVQVHGAGWTSSIAPGDMIWLTISGSTPESSAPVPSGCSFSGNSCVIEYLQPDPPDEPDIDDLTVASWISETGATTYTGHVVIQNPTDYELAAWTLEFNSPSLITDIEHVDWDRIGSQYRVTGTGWARPVPAHGFVFFTFHGVHQGSPTGPISCTLNGVSCTLEDPDHIIDTPRMEVFMKVDEFTEGLFEGYLSIKNPSSTNLSSWTLRFKMVDEITRMEGVDWRRSGDRYEVTGVNGKRLVRGDGGEVIVPIEGVVDGIIEDPEDCTINGVLCLMDAEGTKSKEDAGVDDGGDNSDGGNGSDGGGDDGNANVSCDSGPYSSILPEIDFRFLSVTANRYVAIIQLDNVDNKPIRDWSLAFDLVDGMTVERHWNAIMTETSNGYQVVNTPDNGCILPDESIQFGFDGTHDGSYAEPIGCQFGGEICIFQKMSIRSTGRESNGDLQQPERVDLSVSPVWPNPFSSTAEMTIEGDVAQYVRADMTDVQGRLVRVLFEGTIAPGVRKQVHLTGTNLSSGLYLVRIVNSTGKTVSRTVVYQK